MSRLQQQMHLIKNFQSHQVQRCDFCSGHHPNEHYFYPEQNQEELQYVNNKPRKGNFSNPNSYSNNFLQGWRGNHNQGYSLRQQASPSQRQPPYQHNQNQPSTEQRMSKLEDTLEKFMQASLTNQKNTEASIINLEAQVGTLEKQIGDSQSG
jgi:hypothetical protein